MKAQEWKLLGHFSSTGIPLRGLISKIPSTYVFFECALLAETISDPKRKKTILFFLWFWSCCPPPVWFLKAQECKLLGPFFFYRYTLAGSNIKNSIHIRVFWTRTPDRNHFRPQAQKNYLILSLILVFVVHHQYGFWRLKSEKFWITFFFTGIPLRGLISKIPSTYVFFERAPLAETISDPKGKKTILFFLWFWYLLSTTSMVYEGSKVKTFWVTFFFYRYTLAGSNIKNSIHIRVFWTCTPGRNHFRPQGQKNYLILSLILVLLSTTSMVFEGSRVKTFGSPFSLQVYPCGV